MNFYFCNISATIKWELFGSASVLFDIIFKRENGPGRKLGNPGNHGKSS